MTATPDYSPYGYLGLRSPNPPKQWFLPFDPTVNDYRNFNIGDEWLNTTSLVWWKLASVANAIAIWETIAGGGGAMIQITAGDGTIAIPMAGDINLVNSANVTSTASGNNITISSVGALGHFTTGDGATVTPIAGDVNFVNGNGVETTGATNNITTNMKSPFTGNFTFVGDVTANDFNLSANTGQIKVAGNGIVARAAIHTAADGTYVLAVGTLLSGIYLIGWDSANRQQHLVVSIDATEFDGVGTLSVLANRPYLGQVILSNLQLQITNTNLVALTVDVGNRNGATDGLTITCYTAYDTSINGFNNQLAPSGIVLSAPLPFTGTDFDLVSSNQNFLALTSNSAGNSVLPALTIRQGSSTGSNNIGVQQLFQHQQADKTIVEAASIYSIAPNAGTNVQTSQWRVQTNLTGSLADRFWVSDLGLATNGVDFFTYSKNSWTPRLVFGGGSTGITYTIQLGTWVKVGNLVWITVSLQLTSKGSDTGEAQILGIPFGDFKPAVFPISADNLTFTGQINARLAGASGSNIFLDQVISGAPITPMNDTNFANNTVLNFSGTYYTLLG